MQRLPEISKDLQYIKKYYRIRCIFGEIFNYSSDGSLVGLKFRDLMILDEFDLETDSFNDDNPKSPITVALLIECVKTYKHWIDIVYPQVYI